MILLRVAAFLLGAGLVTVTLLSAVRTFVLPRSANDPIARFVFHTIRRIFYLALRRADSYTQRDQIMAYYAPFSLLALLPVWLVLVQLGFTGMYWGTGLTGIYQAYRTSGSSLLTLGFASQESLVLTVLDFTAATIGLMLIALLIAYLPSIYSAFSRREAAVALLEVRAGSPPSPVEMLRRYQRIHGLDKLGQQWENWETWFTEVDESHTSLSALVFLRSPQPERSWVTATGTILDTAALTRSSLDIPTDARADLCIRAGFLALRHIAGFFNLPIHPDPHYPDQPISISREEFEAAMDSLAEADIPLKQDREQAWRDFAGWRVNYDQVLTALAELTLAPENAWTKRRQPAGQTGQ